MATPRTNQMSKLSLTQAMRPLGNCSSMLRMASTSCARPQAVMVLCSEAGMLKPAILAP